MKMFSILFCSGALFAAGPVIVPHEEIPEFSLNGNSITGVATSKVGTEEFEAWRTSLGVGCCTPKHSHETEEVFIFLKGEGRAIIGGEEFFFVAPCTVICPAHVEHQFFNMGDEVTDAIVVLGRDSQIYNGGGEKMSLPWRNST